MSTSSSRGIMVAEEALVAEVSWYDSSGGIVVAEVSW